MSTNAKEAKHRRQLAIVFLLCTVALVLTPYGSRLAAYPLELALFQPINLAKPVISGA